MIATTPTFSIVIPARNEEFYLPRCLQAIDEAASHIQAPIEIIVVLNRCTDSTEQIALQRNCRIVQDDSKNLAKIRNSGAKVATGNILITVDADSIMSNNMLKVIEEKLRSPHIVGGGVAMRAERYSLGILVTAFFLLPIALWHRVSAGLFFCRLDDFKAIGGFDESLSSVEDIDFALRLKCHGKKSGRKFITIFKAYIRTSCRKFDRLGDWYFIVRPWLFMTLLKGRNQAAADKIWYDFKR